MKPITIGDPPSRDEITRKAYALYLTQGCPQGKDIQHWLEAEAQLIKLRKAGSRSIVT